jgi:hypothetical protein
MPKLADVSLVRIGTYTSKLEWLHLWETDEEIDNEFNSVCQTIWGYTLDDFDDDNIPKEDHDWLDKLIDLPFNLPLMVMAIAAARDANCIASADCSSGSNSFSRSRKFAILKCIGG